MRRGLLALFALSALLASGCATLFSGRTQKIQVVSTPASARFVVESETSSGGQVSSHDTSAEIILPRKKSNIRLRIEKDGFEAVEIALQQKTNGTLALNLINPMIPGLAIADGSAAARAGALAAIIGVWVGVDLATGAAYRLDPSRIEVTLVRNSNGDGKQPPRPQDENSQSAPGRLD